MSKLSKLHDFMSFYASVFPFDKLVNCPGYTPLLAHRLSEIDTSPTYPAKLSNTRYMDDFFSHTKLYQESLQWGPEDELTWQTMRIDWRHKNLLYFPQCFVSMLPFQAFIFPKERKWLWHNHPWRHLCYLNACFSGK